jgi:O-antigen/teichoic acid export membrane protein
MSDSSDRIPPREDDLTRSDDTGSSPNRSDLPATKPWRIRWRERAFAWLDETLSRKTAEADPFYLKTVLPVMDRLAGIGSGLIAMVMVDRHYGPAGLGIFAWFFSLLAIAGYLARYGIPVYLENRIARSPDSADESCIGAMAALIATGFAAMILCGAAAFSIAGPDWGTSDRILYLLLGPTVLFQNINALRLALLNGTGRHREAAGLRIRQRVVFLAAILVLCFADVPVHLLAAAFLFSQVVILGMGRKRVKLPAISKVLAGRRHIPTMMDNGRAFLFTDNLLDVVFYLDMLILGWFVSPVELGIYARALILARLFLVIPGGFRPVFRRLANERLAAGLDDRLHAFMARTIRSLFFAHGCLAVLFMVNFPRVMTMVFDMRQWADESFAVFALVLPGLIFFSAVTALEPVFEARQQSEKLKQMTLVVSIANLILNFNLIPFAGLAGAAMATAVSMFVHFWLFCRMLPADLGGVRIFWPGAAAALYLTYVLLTVIDIGMIVSLMAAPILFGALLWLVGFFNSSYPPSSNEPMQHTPA